MPILIFLATFLVNFFKLTLSEKVFHYCVNYAIHS